MARHACCGSWHERWCRSKYGGYVPKRLIGRVIEVNAASSKIELLTSENQNSNHFPVRISGKDGELWEF